MRETLFTKNFFCLILSGFLSAIAFSQDFPEPKPAQFVHDFANILEENESKLLDQKLRNYEDSTSNEIAVVTVANLAGYEIEDYATRLFGKWGIGKKDKDNGILILIAPTERKLRIEVGYGLEGKIPDLFAKEVIANALLPSVKENKFYEGIDKTTTLLIAKAAGEYVAVKKASSDNFFKRWGGWFIFALIFYFFAPWRVWFGLEAASQTFSSNGRDYWSSSSSDSSDSFSSFGGGDSGGGGASGSW